MLSTAILTYAFWLITAKFAGSEVIGVVSYISSLVIIISTANSIDLSLGMKRSLGLAIAEQDTFRYRRILLLSTCMVSLFVTVTVALLSIPSLGIWEMLGIDNQFFLLVILMIIVTPFHNLMIEALIAARRSKALVIPFAAGCMIRFPLFFIAFYILDSPTTAALISYSSLFFISTILFVSSLPRNSLSISARNSSIKSKLIIKETLRAGLSSWIPHVIFVLGSQLGIITTTAASGAADGGRFYIALGIFMVTLFIIMGITKVTHSLVGGMSTAEEQNIFVSYSIRIGCIFTMVIAAPFLFFSDDILFLLGSDFSKASSTLSILMLNMPFVIISEIIYYYAYGKGNHSAVLYLGLTGNLPRIVLYFILPQLIGVNGAAVAYFVGSVMQFIISIMIAKKEMMVLDLKSYSKMVMIPVIIAFGLWITGLNFIVSTLIIISASFAIYIKLNMIKENEIKDITYTILPRAMAARLFPFILKIMKVLSNNNDG